MALRVTICRVVTVFACILAGVTLIEAMIGREQSAIQQSAAAAFAIGIAVIPYVFTRMFEGFLFQDADPKPGQPADPG